MKTCPSKRIRPFLLICLPFLAVSGGCDHRPSAGDAPTPALHLHVGPQGNDSNPGSPEQPLASLDGARDKIRALKAAGSVDPGDIVVEIAPGTYQLDRPFVLGAEDSALPGHAVIYRATEPGSVRLLAGRMLEGWKTVDDPAVLERLDPVARGKVVQLDLRASGIRDLPTLKERGSLGFAPDPRVELFFRNKAMTLARWPNEGFVRIADIVFGDEMSEVYGKPVSGTPAFFYSGERPTRWLEEPEIWLHGYWVFDWSDHRIRVKSIDPAAKRIDLATSSGRFKKDQWFYAYNLLVELDSPGEWYLDRDRGMLYFWPPDVIRPGDTIVSELQDPVLLDGVTGVTLSGLTIEAARGQAVTVRKGRDCSVVGCTIRNIGGWAVIIEGGEGHRVAGCDIHDVGQGGILLIGGDRLTLTAGRHVAENNHIYVCGRWDSIYHPGIQLIGVGLRAAHNLIHDLPHTAIGFSGNDHLIEYNRIRNVVKEVNDGGAIYSHGVIHPAHPKFETWTMRGNVIRYNYLSDMSGFKGTGLGCQGVYLDDMFSSVRIYGNFFHKIDGELANAVAIGGGRDTLVEENLFLDCKKSLFVDDRALNWAAKGVMDLEAELRSLPLDRPPWSTRYPELRNLLNDSPREPRGNLFAHNVVCGPGEWSKLLGLASKLTVLRDNLIDTDPHFVDAAKGDYRLRDDSPAWAVGFKPIPFEKIGLYPSEERASWPVALPPDDLVQAEGDK